MEHVKLFPRTYRQIPGSAIRARFGKFGDTDFDLLTGIVTEFEKHSFLKASLDQ
jgi:hypothetical protein